MIKRRTARKHRCRTTRQAPVKDQYQRLCLKLRGHFRLLEEVRRFAEKAWRYWLSRRSSKSAIGWEQFQRLLQTYVLPTPKIVHTI